MGGEGAMKKKEERANLFREVVILVEGPDRREPHAQTPVQRNARDALTRNAVELGGRFTPVFDRVSREGATEEFCGEVAGPIVAMSVADCVSIVDGGNGGRVMGWVANATETAIQVLDKPKRRKPAAGGKPKAAKPAEATEPPKAVVVTVSPAEEQRTPGRTHIDMEGMVIEVPKPNQQEAPKEEETPKVVEEAKKKFAESKKDFVIVDRMAKEYSKGNYDAVLALDAVAKRDKNAAYALATSDRLMVIATMIMQQRRQPQDTFFSGITFAFTGIGARNYGLAAGEPTEEGQKSKEEMRTAEAKASAETREYAAQATAMDEAIAQVLAQLPAIAEAQGLEITETTGPFTHVEITIAGAPRQETPSARQPIATPVLPEHLAPDFAPVLAKAPKIRGTAPASTTRTPAPIERTVAKGEEPKRLGGAAKTGKAKAEEKEGKREEAEAPKIALTLSPEEQKVYAAAVERLQELVDEGTRKTAGKKVEERKPKAA